jgi:hypothetical protein
MPRKAAPDGFQANALIAHSASILFATRAAPAIPDGPPRSCTTKLMSWRSSDSISEVSAREAFSNANTADGQPVTLTGARGVKTEAAEIFGEAQDNVPPYEGPKAGVHKEQDWARANIGKSNSAAFCL